MAPSSDAHLKTPYKPIALVGLPGGGKSTIGRQLAKRLDWRFLDSDHVFEQRVGASIRHYFDLHGEVDFRDREASLIDELVRDTETVLATGGGVVLREANRAALKAHCTVVYLRSTPEELHRRLRHDTQRPLLQVKDPLAKLRELQAVRDPLYQEVAHFTVDTGRPSIPTIVNTILMQLELAGLVPAGYNASPGGRTTT